jgi:putative glycosyltransferase
MKFSLVTTLYYSEDHIVEFHERVSKLFKGLGESYEIIYVDDGSPDASIRIIHEIRNSDSNTRILKLSRNFGHHTAILAGLEHSVGDVIFVIDSDLEEKPESLVTLYDALQSQSELEMVYGIQTKRKGNIFERISGSIYYTLINALSDFKIEPNQLTSRVMTRKFVNALNSYQDKTFTFSHLVSQLGFKTHGIRLVKESSSDSTYTLKGKINLAITSLTLGSTRMLGALFVLGFSVLGLGVFITCTTLILWLISPSIPGWTSLLCSVWLLGGLTMISMGILAKYIENTLIESKSNPRYIVDWFL